MDLGAALAGVANAVPAAQNLSGYQQALLAQSQLPVPPPAAARQFPVPHPWRPNMTAPNGITATPTATPQPSVTPPRPGRPTPRVATSPTAPIRTPFSDYRGTTMGSASGHLSSVKGFTS